MLRSLVPKEPELVRLCRSRNWEAVSRRSQTHPFEATPSESALRGEGATALVLAIRMNAPIYTLQSLVKACIEQVAVVQRRGSVLIEALRYRAPSEVLDFVLKAIVHHQTTNHNRIDVLSATDEIGRTALHYVVERVKIAFERGEPNSINYCVLRDLLQARPALVQTLDHDGHTPLVLLLLLPRVPDNNNRPGIEKEILRMVQLMVSACPWVATISRRLPEPWHSGKQHGNVRYSPAAWAGGNMDGSPTPLYYAILHGRSLDTVEALIDANQKVGINACATIISQHHEVPLHTAICTQASLPVVERLLQGCPNSVNCADANGLTPVDWMWIRHVADWHTQNTPHTLVSRGRYLAGRFLGWHQDVSRELYQANRPFAQPGTSTKTVTKELLSLMELLLPAAAAAASLEGMCKSWSMLQAACYVPCPQAVVHLAVESSDPMSLQQRDSDGRLPLHWAAARFGYTANYPVGVSRSTKRLAEHSAVPSLVSRFPLACSATDDRGQLPFHIAIDAARHYREVSKTSVATARFKLCEVDFMEDEILNVLLSSHPDSLECPDGKSGLLPFQQAAIGLGARLNTIYVLLRLQPTLLSGRIADIMECCQK